MTERTRGQLVLAAAAVVAVALAPVVLAYLQLGYHPDIAATADRGDLAANGVRVLERAVHGASVGIPAEYRWDRRRVAVREVHDRLAPRLETLATSRVAEGTAYTIEYNQSAATRRRAADCPGGHGRAFGPCEAHDGVIVQERAGETHVVTIAFDLTVTTDRGRSVLTVVVRAIGGTEDGPPGPKSQVRPVPEQSSMGVVSDHTGLRVTSSSSPQRGAS